MPFAKKKLLISCTQKDASVYVDEIDPWSYVVGVVKAHACEPTNLISQFK